MLNQSDITKLQELTKNDPEVSSLIEKLLKDQQIMISSISHELKNPLAIIDGTMQLLEKEQPQLTGSSLWIRTRKDVLQMAALLDDLSSYNKRLNLSLTSFSIENMLYDLADSFYYSLEECPDIEFTSDIEPGLPVFTGDKNKLRETILNLLVNARDALDGHGCVCLDAFVENDRLFIEVSDNGCGIPQEHLPHIFEPFVTYKPYGTGLGLALVKSIAEAHKGTVEVSSDSEMTIFSISLPVSPP